MQYHGAHRTMCSWPKPCGAGSDALHAAVCPVVEPDAGSLGGADEQPELGAVAGADCESERAYGCADAELLLSPSGPNIHVLVCNVQGETERCSPPWRAAPLPHKRAALRQCPRRPPTRLALAHHVLGSWGIIMTSVFKS